MDREQKTTEVSGESPGLGPWPLVEWKGQTRVQRVGMGVSEPQGWAVCPGPQAPGTQWRGPPSGWDPGARSSPGPREDASEGPFGEMCPEGVMGRSGEPMGAQLVGRDPGQPCGRAWPFCRSPRRIPRRQLPQGHHRVLCPPLPRRQDQGAGGACERVCKGPRAQGCHLRQASCRRRVCITGPPGVPPTQVSVTSPEACVSSYGPLTQHPESQCRETELSSLNRAGETEVTWRSIL